MNPLTWHFRLDGDASDINDITDLFSEEVRLVKDEIGKTHLVMELPFTPSDARAAHDAAEELTAKMNAVVQSVYGNHENVRVSAQPVKRPVDSR
jgi:hypothetical protein